MSDSDFLEIEHIAANVGLINEALITSRILLKGDAE